MYSIGIKRTSHQEFYRQIEATNIQQSKIAGSPSNCDPFANLNVEILEIITKLMDPFSRNELFKVSRAAMRFRSNNLKWARNAHFSISSKAVVHAVRIFCDYRAKKLFCSSLTAWNEILKLWSKGQLGGIETLKVAGLDLSIGGRLIAKSLPKSITKVRLKNCILDDTIALHLVTNCQKLHTLWFDNCRIKNEMNQEMLTEVSPSLRVLGVNCEIDSNWNAFCSRFLQKTQCSTEFYARHDVAAPPANDPRSFETARIGIHRKRGFITSLAINSPQDLECTMTDFVQNLLVVSGSLNYALIASMKCLRSLHILSQEVELEKLVRVIYELPNLLEIGIHHSAAFKVVEMIKLVESLNVGRTKRLICLPQLSVMPMDRKQQLALQFPKTRIIFDPALAARISNRFWKINKSYQP